MKLEKRSSGGEGDMPPVQEEKPAKSKPVVVYIMILFIAAFLLMALSFLMHQRSNTEALGQLQNSVSAMQESTARSIIAGGLSVRQTEALVKRLTAEKKPVRTPDPHEVDYVAEAQRELTAQMGRGVKIVTGRKKGRVELEYYGMDDLNDLLEALALIRLRRENDGQ